MNKQINKRTDKQNKPCSCLSVKENKELRYMRPVTYPSYLRKKAWQTLGPRNDFEPGAQTPGYTTFLYLPMQSAEKHKDR